MADFRIKVFLSVANNLNFTKAAKELCISQPAVTKHIRSLEEQYQVRLFKRFGSKITLTQAGLIMLPYAKQILAKYNELNSTIHALNNDFVGNIRIGASTTIAQYILPPILAKFTECYPKISISLITGNTYNIEKDLIYENIDIGLVEGITHQKNLQYTDFLNDELVAIIANDNTLIDKKEISIEEFKHVPLVLRETGSGTLETIEHTLSENNLKLSDLNVKINLGNTEAIKSFIKHSSYMGIVSYYSVKKEIADHSLRIIDIENIQFLRQFRFVTRQGEILNIFNKIITFVQNNISNI